MEADHWEDFPQPRERQRMEEKVAVDFREQPQPRLAPRRTVPPKRSPPVANRPTPPGKEGEGRERLRQLMRDCCSALKRPLGEAEKWTAHLASEWMESHEQLKALSPEGWTRLGLPLGLESELQRRLKFTATRPRSAQPRLQRSSSAERTPAARRQMPAASLGNAVRSSVDTSNILSALKASVGEGWALHLLSALSQKRHGVDANSLLSALRALGVTRIGSTQLRSTIRAAAEGSEQQGSPTAEAVVAAIHGPLKASRARAVATAFAELSGSTHSVLPMTELRQQFNALELPSVRAGRTSAQEALQELTRAWRGLQAVGLREFAASHVLLSATHRGEESQFEVLVRRLWRLPCAAEREEGQVEEPALVKRRRSVGAGAAVVTSARGRQHGRSLANENATAALSAASGTCPSCGSIFLADSNFCRNCGLQRVSRLQQEPSEASSIGNRVTSIEENVQSSNRAAEQLGRLRIALRKRGSDSLEALARRFRLADRRGQGRIGVRELQQALHEVGVGASAQDILELLRGMDIDGNGIDFEEWLRVIRGPLSPVRAAVVRETFESLDTNREGFIEVGELLGRFQASRHPEVEAGRKSCAQVTKEQLALLDRNRDGRLSLAEFLKYYEVLSAGIDKDLYFAHMVKSAWGLDPGPNYVGARHERRAYEGHIQSTEGGLCGP